MKYFRYRRYGIATYLAALLSGATIMADHATRANEPGEGRGRVVSLDQPIVFSIPAQNLADALDQFSRTSNLQVLYDSGLAVGQRSTAVNGILPIKTALQTLLQGTGLLIHYTRHHDVVLTSIKSDEGIAPAAPSLGEEGVLSLKTLFVYPSPLDVESPIVSRTPYRLYGSIVQSKILEMLQRNAATNKGSYGVKLAVWVSPSGMLLRHRLLQSSGDATRDRTILRLLGGMDFGRPPPEDLPQPIEVGIRVAAP